MIQKIEILSLVILIAVVVMGCETSQGFGRDVQHLGKDIERV